ncbi:MAG: hypothetical protein H6707_04060 [Deltaproteobacteria bacterium]|nr:hypothetical protein [Deltaproteobacteria bacterium]
MTEIRRDEEVYPTFRTKTGICTIEPGRILISREGSRGFLARLLVGNSIKRILVVYSFFGVVLLGVGSLFLMTDRLFEGAMLVLSAALLLRAVIKSRHNTAASEIAREDVIKIENHEPNEGLTRGYFTVHYQEKDAVKKRLIMLPGSLSKGTDEYQKAVNILRDQGLLS